MARKEQQTGGKSWIFWGGGLLILIVVIVVGLLTIPTGSNEAEEPEDEGLNAEGPDPSEQPIEPEDPAEGDAPERCEDMDADDSFPTEAPEFVWEDFEGTDGLALPVSEEHGPVVQENGFWRCFSQTPAGAAFAAPSLFMDFVVSREYEAAVDSPGAREAVPQEPVEESAAGFDGTLVRGFRIVDSSDQEATVSVWLSLPEQSVDGAYEFTLLWDEDANDWRLDLAAGQAPLSMLSETSDFTEWR